MSAFATWRHAITVRRSILPSGILLNHPFQDALISLENSRRFASHPNAEQLNPSSLLAKHQRWLWEGKRELLAALPREAVLRITYDRLLDKPRDVAQNVSDFIGLRPSAQQLDRAAATIDAGQRHIRAA